MERATIHAVFVVCCVTIARWVSGFIPMEYGKATVFGGTEVSRNVSVEVASVVRLIAVMLLPPLASAPLFTTTATCNSSSIATLVGLGPTVTGEPATCVFVAKLMMLTLFDPVFAITARPNAGSIAIADGVIPTANDVLGAVGNDVGSTPIFMPEIPGFGGTTCVFSTMIGDTRVRHNY